jgi:hypothetical protein
MRQKREGLLVVRSLWSRWKWSLKEGPCSAPKDSITSHIEKVLGWYFRRSQWGRHSYPSVFIKAWTGLSPYGLPFSMAVRTVPPPVKK